MSTRPASLILAPDRATVWLVIHRASSTEALAPPGSRCGADRLPQWTLLRWEHPEPQLSDSPDRRDVLDVLQAAEWARAGAADRAQWVIAETTSYAHHLFELVEESVAKAGSLRPDVSRHLSDVALDLMSQLRAAAERPWCAWLLYDAIDHLWLLNPSALQLDDRLTGRSCVRSAAA
jgi:hypothetical protein